MKTINHQDNMKLPHDEPVRNKWTTVTIQDRVLRQCSTWQDMKLDISWGDESTLSSLQAPPQVLAPPLLGHARSVIYTRDKCGACCELLNSEE